MKNSGTQAFVNHLLVFTIVSICGSGSIGLGAVWLRHQIAVTAAANKQHEVQLAELGRQLDAVNSRIEREQSTEQLERRNVAWNLGLQAPSPARITRIDGSPIRLLAEKQAAAIQPDSFLADVRFQFPQDR